MSVAYLNRVVSKLFFPTSQPLYYWSISAVRVFPCGPYVLVVWHCNILAIEVNLYHTIIIFFFFIYNVGTQLPHDLVFVFSLYYSFYNLFYMRWSINNGGVLSLYQPLPSTFLEAAFDTRIIVRWNTHRYHQQLFTFPLHNFVIMYRIFFCWL